MHRSKEKLQASVTARFKVARTPSLPHTLVMRRIVSVVALTKSPGSSFSRSRSKVKVVSESAVLTLCRSRLEPTRGSQREGNLLQPYCNRAGTGRYAADKPVPQNRQKPHK